MADNNFVAPGTKPKRYDGEYIGKVESVSDPKGLMRAQVRVYDLFDNVPKKDLPWAEYKLPIGHRANDGDFTPVDVSDLVWVDFPHNGDTRRPRITGSVHYCPGGDPNFPDDAWAGPGKLTHKRIGDEVEPEAAEYHKDRVFSQHGIVIEVVDNSGNGAYRITQRNTGTAVEIDGDGNVTLHSENNYFSSSVNNKRQIIGKTSKIEIGEDRIHKVTRDETETVGRDKTLTVTGDETQTVEGDKTTTIKGNREETVETNKSCTIKGTWGVKIEGNAQIESDSELTLTAININFRCNSFSFESKDGSASSMQMKGDIIHVEGDYTQQDGNITSPGTVTAPYFDGTAKLAEDLV